MALPVLEPLPVTAHETKKPTPISKPRIPADYRILTDAEIQQVVPVFEAMGATLPDPALSTIVGAVKNGRVVGFIVLQLCLHAEPMWIEPGHSEVFNGISRTAQNVVAEKCGGARVFLFADADKVERLSDINEFERIYSPVYTKYIPAKAAESASVQTSASAEPTLDDLSILSDSELEILTRPGNADDGESFEGGAFDVV